MNRTNFNFKELQELGYSKDDIVNLTDIAIDPKISDFCFNTIIDSQFKNDILENIIKVIKRYSDNTDEEFKFNPDGVLVYITKYRSKSYLYKIIDLFLKYDDDTLKIFIDNYNDKFDEYGIELFSFINNTSDKDPRMEFKDIYNL